METKDRTSHIGRKIARIRELRGMKQDALAIELGVSQQAISKLEQSETVEEEMLERVAKVLGVNSKAIENFSEESAISYINNFNDNSVNHGANFNYQCTINPIEKWMEALDENKRLYEEKQKLMERLLESEREKVEILKRKH